MREDAARAVVADYLGALARRDLGTARTLLADDFTFRGPGMEDAIDRQTFLSEFGDKYDHVRDLRVLRQAHQDGHVASLYELEAETPQGAATFLMTEWTAVLDGRIESALLVFDTAPGAQLHGRAHAHGHRS